MSVRHAAVGFVAAVVVGSAVASGALAAPATEAELSQMNSVYQSFMAALASKDGASAAALISDEFAAGIERTRDAALDATEQQLRDPRLLFVGVMNLRMNFSASELIGESGRALFAALVDKGLSGSPSGARFMARERVVAARITDEPALRRAHIDVALNGRVQDEAGILTAAHGEWRLPTLPVLLFFSDSVPDCVWTLLQAERDPSSDPACNQEAIVAGKPTSEFITAVMKGGQTADDEYDRLHQPEAFAALMRHPYDPQYWQPMRAVAAH